MEATTLTVTSPPPASGKFIADTATDTIVSLAYTIVAGTVGPTGVNAYLSNDDGSVKSTTVTVGGGIPDGSDLSTSGTFTAMTAEMTIDATNCLIYTKICFVIVVVDDDTSNNAVCLSFGITTDAAGTKICSGNKLLHQMKRNSFQSVCIC